MLRKKGAWDTFPQDVPSYPSGRALYCAGKFIGPINMPKVDQENFCALVPLYLE